MVITGGKIIAGRQFVFETRIGTGSAGSGDLEHENRNLPKHFQIIIPVVL